MAPRVNRALLVLLLSAPLVAARANEVYVNGVNVEGLTNQTFERVTVRLDEKGNVHIDAPGYTVKRVPAGPQEKRAPSLSQRYFLVTEQTSVGATDYDIDVFINGELLRTLGSSEPQLVTEVTRVLRPGRNTITLEAKKRPGARPPAPGASKPDVFRVIIGEGGTHQDKVTIDRPLITFTTTAAETQDVTQEFNLTAR